MKSTLPFVLLLGLSAWTLDATAADKLIYKGAFRGSKVRIEGTSTIHDWHAESALIRGTMELDPSFPTDPANKELKPGKVDATAKISIVVQTFRSSSGSAMDAVMQETMDAKNHKTIEFELKELDFKEFKDDAMVFDAKGDLKVHGQTKAVSMPVQIVRPDAKTLKVTGTTTAKMTEFGMTPPAPKLALGAIKTGDDVKLIIEWTAQKTGEGG
jgi:polyisoprenoid-binding protein YceI